jgi:antitoxin component YwqK of YwqJK toxin-antitoxin module
MRPVFIIIAGLLLGIKSYSQIDSAKSIYSKLDTIKTYSVNLTYETGFGYARYYVNGMQVDKMIYDRYQIQADNFLSCKPCYLKSYDINDVLVRASQSYGDCTVGISIEYYPNGGVKILGHYKQNDSNDWTNIYQRGFCSVRSGKWTYYDSNGKIIKTENYKDGKLSE